MPKTLLIFLLCLFSGAAAAQTAPATSTVARPAARASLAGYDDTLRAVSHMFGRRRTGGAVWLAVAGLGALTAVRAAAGTTTNTSAGAINSRPNSTGIGLVFLVYAGVPAGIGIGKLSRFSQAREEEVTTAYRDGRALPRSISRRLRRKDF